MAERNESDLTAEPFQMVNSPAEYASAPEEPHGANPSAAAHDSAARIRETENTAPVHASGKTRLASPPLAEPTFLSRLYDLLALGGLLILSLILLAQVLPGLPGTRALWFPDELRQADILRGLLRGEWFELYLNGEPYQQIPPLYFWLMAALHKGLALVGLYVGEDIAPLLFTGTALSGLLMLWAVFALASGAARLDRRGSFAAGCVLLSAFGSFFHYANPDLLFAALVILSQTLLYQGLIRRRAPLRLGLAFACTALAIMTKGWLGLYLPLLSAALFCLWSGRPWRLFKPDFLFGLLFALLP
ncbi:MAG: hypothetical protein LBD82_05770, partial [Deltaproteobacteria bacterium]|nr:hypothetical protein [Deltaproteobacteria bacterium]